MSSQTPTLHTMARRGTRAWFATTHLVVAMSLAIGLSLVPADPADSHGPGPGIDMRIEGRLCSLLGREYLVGRGCRRDQCVPGAVMFNHLEGAEVCGVRRDGSVHPFATAVDFRRCRALHRQWIPQVNWCASDPYRDHSPVEADPACRAPDTDYVVLEEAEPFYDECLRPARVRRLTAWAAADHRSLASEARIRSPLLCSYWPGHTFRGHRCQVSSRPTLAPGGILVIGDSITWRGTDELARLRPGWTIDGYPSRTYDDLASRLTWYNRGHREPTTVIVELGANPAHHVGKRNLTQILGTLPTTTLLVLLTPYRADPGSHGRVAPYIAAYTRWIQAIARRHPHSCLADWHSYVVRHPHVLVDGVHPTSHGEGVWATWVSRAYHTCAAG